MYKGSQLFTFAQFPYIWSEGLREFIYPLWMNVNLKEERITTFLVSVQKEELSIVVSYQPGFRTSHRIVSLNKDRTEHIHRGNNPG